MHNKSIKYNEVSDGGEKMIRKIIEIDEDKCNGCGACAKACHEGAIAMVNGKAKLIRDDYCDGLGDCLPTCPTDAIHFVEREAAAYDEAAVQANKKQQEKALACGCPGTQARAINRAKMQENRQDNSGGEGASQTVYLQAPMQSELSQWPVQIKLVAPNAGYFNGANLLIAADCTAYAYGDFHNQFIKNRIALIGCPKLDEGDYTEKLTAIISQNDIKSVTIVRMEVPCCGGIEHAAKTAIQNSGKFLPWQVVTISTDGKILN